MLPVFLEHDPLPEVSGVKVPGPASPFITHETASDAGTAVAVSRGDEIDSMHRFDSNFYNRV